MLSKGASYLQAKISLTADWPMVRSVHVSRSGVAMEPILYLRLVDKLTIQV